MMLIEKVETQEDILRIVFSIIDDDFPYKKVIKSLISAEISANIEGVEIPDLKCATTYMLVVAIEDGHAVVVLSVRK